MTTIPGIRAEMLAYLDNNGWAEYISIPRYTLARWERELHRRPPLRRRRPSRRITPPRREIIRAAAEHPDWDLEQIAQHFGTNIARVSEAISGIRK